MQLESKRILEVYPPARCMNEVVERQLSRNKEREISDRASRISRISGSVVGLGVEGEQSYEEDIPVRFQLNMFRGKSKNTFSNKLKEDLIQWFGPVQYADASEEYLGTLQKIAAVTGVKTAVDVKVPVKMYCSAIVSDLATISGDMKPLKDI
ncbi:hypothetical protein PPTG_17236 [Phytophthora nicotianae INRA-310]|uniref:Uncharacterized protein n=1 Tax=Phytophthora nicotianae (strain INRA-310) TaxID=761204 RepID=W2PMN3_PHYN3|nr:hypothetical protein PPTG_17236 [Phytophthora nicotianae INRA-310]ETN01514.1 hypothetical protein PPTG_17236 [Phytophthora nicotianae INRA-310]